MIYNARSFSFSVLNLVFCFNINCHMFSRGLKSDLPNAIVINSRPGLFKEMIDIKSFRFSVRTLNMTENTLNGSSILSLLDKLYDCSTLAVIGICEKPAVSNLIQMWTEEKKIYFISYSCTVKGPFAKLENNVFQLDSGISLYSTAIANNLEINMKLFRKFGIGILVDRNSFISLELLKSLKQTMLKVFSGNAIFFTVSISGSMNSTQIRHQLKKCQEFSVPMIMLLCDLDLAVKILNFSSDFHTKTMQYIMNPFTNLLLTDISSSVVESPDNLLKISKNTGLGIQFAKREFMMETAPRASIISVIELILRFTAMSKNWKNCYCLSKRRLIAKYLSSLFFEDGSLKQGEVSFYRLSKNITKFQKNGENHFIEAGYFSKCRTWKINNSENYIHPLSLCDNLPEMENKKYLRKKIRILIEYHESLLWVNNQSDTEADNFRPMMHQVVCHELYHSHNHFCSGLLVHLLETIGKHLDIDFLYVYTENVPISSIKTASEMISNTSIQALIFSMKIDFIHNPFLDITEPFGFLEYAVMADLSDHKQLLGAAFRPFTFFVWIMICIIATVCAVAMALYEWHSPFGLNPWGRQRNINYSLASALTSVWAMLFGHTIHTKAPKSWPVKVLKNFWACACIVIVAMYTANLTVFIAGILQNDICYYYRDGKFRAAMKTKLEGISIQLRHMNCLNLSSNSIIIVKDDEEAQKLFLNKTVQILIGEKNELENFQYTNSLCKSVILPLGWNSFGFSFGFQPGSPLFKEISQLLLHYQTIGFMDLLTKSYIKGAPKCSLTMMSNNTNKGYGIENVSGCFLFMGIGFLVSLLVLLLEHILFRLIVPQWRNLPETSKWKSISILFMSQRLHRVIHSERLIKPTETTREMIAIVRNREFHKMFFKENMHKPVPSRIISPTKISVFDISSEMVKMKRRSFESIAAFENCSNHSSLDESHSKDNAIISNMNSAPTARAPLVSIDDEDFVFTPVSNKQFSDETHSNFSSSSRYLKYKWRKKPLLKMSKDSLGSLNSFIGSTESKSKYSKNPKLFYPSLTPTHGERKQKTLLRMQCLDQD